MKEKGLTMHGLEVKLPGNKHHSILNLCSGGAVKAETEMLIPCNPAAKATPPKADDHVPNYFQPEEIAWIWEALEGEPIKWKMNGASISGDREPQGRNAWPEVG